MSDDHCEIFFPIYNMAVLNNIMIEWLCGKVTKKNQFGELPQYSVSYQYVEITL